ncbi:hypothetical protein F7P81_13535 [Pseudochrobactrum saccharolyticum]|nr:hypothetical protein F7P81_13535 [Pseudochrobactrum saccharolyticum]
MLFLSFFRPPAKAVPVNIESAEPLYLFIFTRILSDRSGIQKSVQWTDFPAKAVPAFQDTL